MTDKETNAARCDQLARRVCAVMGWDYRRIHAYTAIRARG